MLLRQDTLNVHIYVPYYSGQIPLAQILHQLDATKQLRSNGTPSTSYPMDVMLPQFHEHMSTAAEIL